MRRGAGLLIAAFPLLALAAGAPSFTSLMHLGRSALQTEDFAGARSALEKAVALRPSDVSARYYLARAYAGDKKYQFAVQQLKSLLAIDPSHAQGLIDLASIEENMGKFDEAQAHYRKALEAGPNPTAERGLATLLAMQGRTEEALGILRRLSDADEGDIESRYQLGMVLMQTGACADAIPVFKAVTSKSPNHLGALFNLGNCLNRTGSADEGRQALARFTEASAEKERQVDRRRRAHFLILEAIQRLETGDVGGVLKKLDEAIAVNPTNGRAHAIRAQILDMTQDTAGALAAYQRAAELDPTDPVILVEVGRLMGKTGRPADGLPYLKKAAVLDPGMPEPHLMLSAIYRQLGQAEQAAAEEALYRKLSERH
ncbi:MAG TPA: tetratricopeptide repeat protein [Candidatus Polarisedimenticolia bacterium]|nr:tetratricopeptide repeat protein [Candidatus Polarisedimenticolia bacterium]